MLCLHLFSIQVYYGMVDFVGMWYVNDGMLMGPWNFSLWYVYGFLVLIGFGGS